MQTQSVGYVWGVAPSGHPTSCPDQAGDYALEVVELLPGTRLCFPFFSFSGREEPPVRFVTRPHRARYKVSKSSEGDQGRYHHCSSLDEDAKHLLVTSTQCGSLQAEGLLPQPADMLKPVDAKSGSWKERLTKHRHTQLPHVIDDPRGQLLGMTAIYLEHVEFWNLTDDGLVKLVR